MTTIRAIGPADWASFRDVRLASLADTPSAFAVTYAEAAERSDAEWQRMVQERCASGMSSTWLAENHNGVAVGVVAAFDAEERDVELVSMWVSPDARGDGLARRLVDTVVAWAADRQATGVSLWVTRGNDGAQRLYESTGFVVTGDHQPLPSDPCKDEIRMTRPT